MKKLSLVLILLFCFSASQSFAQFEGKIQFKTYNYKSGQKKTDDDSFVMFITPERLLLRGDKSYKVGGSLKTTGILVRLKKKDFVFMTGKKTAMSISKEGITSFMNMFGDAAEDSVGKAGSDIKITKTGKTKKVNGYMSQKFIFTDKTKPNERAEVWMTKALHINWGMLAEPWSSDKLKGFTGSNIPFKLIFKDGYFPLKLKQYTNKKLSYMGEAKIKKMNIAQSQVQIPSDVKVISLQNYLFQEMRKSQ